MKDSDRPENEWARVFLLIYDEREGHYNFYS